MNTQEFYKNLNDHEGGFHEIILGSSSIYRDSRSTITIEAFSVAGNINSELIFLSSFDIPTTSGLIKGPFLAQKLAIGICTNKKFTEKSEIILMKDVLEYTNISDCIVKDPASYFILFFSGVDQKTGEGVTGLIYSNNEIYFSGIKIVITADDSFRDMLMNLYCHIVDKAHIHKIISKSNSGSLIPAIVEKGDVI